jgi:hypothetical protein
LATFDAFFPLKKILCMSHTWLFWSPSGKNFTQNSMHAWCRRKAIAKRMNIPLLVWKGLGYSNIGLVLDLNIPAASLHWVCSKFSYSLDPGYWVLFKNFHTSMILMYVWSKNDFCMARGRYKPAIEIGIRPVHSIYPRGWYCLHHSSLVSRFFDTSVNTRCKSK